MASNMIVILCAYHFVSHEKSMEFVFWGTYTDRHPVLSPNCPCRLSG